MILKNTENEDSTLHVTLYLPAQIDIDKEGEEMDLWIKSGFYVENEIDGGFILNIKDILLEGAEDEDSAEAILSWLEFYKSEIIKKHNLHQDTPHTDQDHRHP